MIRNENKANEEMAIRGYVEHIGVGKAPKYSIYDPSTRSRTWVIGPGQKTGVITILASTSLYKWITSRSELRFVMVAEGTIVGGGPLAPLPIARHPKLAPKQEHKGTITHMGDEMPTLTPSQMVGRTKGADTSVATPEESGIKHMGKEMPTKTPKEMMGGTKRVAFEEPSFNDGPKPAPKPAPKPVPKPIVKVAEPVVEVVEPIVEVVAPIVPQPFNTGILDDMNYTELKDFVLNNEIPMPKARSAKALLNAVLMYLEEHPEVQLKL